MSAKKMPGLYGRVDREQWLKRGNKILNDQSDCPRDKVIHRRPGSGMQDGFSERRAWSPLRAWRKTPMTYKELLYQFERVWVAFAQAERGQDLKGTLEAGRERLINQLIEEHADLLRKAKKATRKQIEDYLWNFFSRPRPDDE